MDEFDGCNGITVSPDQTLLYVAHFPGRFIYSYQIDRGMADCSTNNPTSTASGPPRSPKVTRTGCAQAPRDGCSAPRRAGIQICDQVGRVNLIVPKPGYGRRVCYVRLHENTLYAATADAVWKRAVKLSAAQAFEPPVLPPKPGL